MLYRIDKVKASWCTGGLFVFSVFGFQRTANPQPQTLSVSFVMFRELSRVRGRDAARPFAIHIGKPLSPCIYL